MKVEKNLIHIIPFVREFRWKISPENAYEKEEETENKKNVVDYRKLIHTKTNNCRI